MIFFIIGQPGAGKTTVGRELQRRIGGVQIDGDELRGIFHDTDYSRFGREKNIQRAMDIALYQRSIYETVIVSMVCPYNNIREKFDTQADVFWVYLISDEDRGKDKYKVGYFEKLTGVKQDIEISTDGTITPVGVVDLILHHIKFCK